MRSFALMAFSAGIIVRRVFSPELYCKTEEHDILSFLPSTSPTARGGSVVAASEGSRRFDSTGPYRPGTSNYSAPRRRVYVLRAHGSLAGALRPSRAVPTVSLRG